MRRILTVLVAIVVAIVVALGGLVAPASAETPFSIASAEVSESRQVVLLFKGDQDLRRVVVQIHLPGQTEPVVTLEDFVQQPRRTKGYVAALSSTVLDLPMNHYQIGVEAWDVTDAHTANRNAGPYDNRIMAWFEELKVTPGSIDYDHPVVTLSGRLMSGRPSGPKEPLAKAAVAASASTLWPSTVTDADGRFVLRGRPENDHVWARYAGDATHRSIGDQQVPIGIVSHATRISATASKTLPGDGRVTVAGKIENQDRDGRWHPLEVIKPDGVEYYWRTAGSSDRYLGRTVSDTSGNFHKTVSVTGTGSLVVHYPQSWALFPADRQIKTVTTLHATRIDSFNASPEPVRKGKTITVQGTLKRYVPSWKAYGKQGVKVYFEAKGSKRWAYVGKVTTDAKGRFGHGFKAVKDGTWRVVFGGNSGSSGVTGPGDFVDVR